MADYESAVCPVALLVLMESTTLPQTDHTQHVFFVLVGALSLLYFSASLS